MNYLTIKQVAEITNHNPSTIYGWLKIGLPHVRMNGIRIKDRDLEEWLERYKEKMNKMEEGDG